MMEKFDQTCVSLDLETTGLDPKTDEIIEIGAIKFKGKKILDKFSTLVNPQKKVSSSILAFCGINEEELKKAPFFSEIKEKLVKFIGNWPILGHNIDFDLEFLAEKELRLKNPRYDTWYLSTMLFPTLNSHSLISLASFLEIHHLETHRALPDASATYELFLILVEKIALLPSSLLLKIRKLLAKSDLDIKDLFQKIKPKKEAQLPKKEKKIEKKEKVEQLILPALPVRSRERPEVGKIILDKKKLTFYAKKVGFNSTDLETLKAVDFCFKEEKKIFIESEAQIFAYLIPSAYSALRYIEPKVRYNPAGKIIFAVSNPQEYLSAVENLKEIIPFDFKVTLLKEPKEYLCLRKFEQFKKKELSSEELRFLVKILLWFEKTSRGEKSELTLVKEENKFWKLIASDEISCLKKSCSSENCFFRKAQTEAHASHLIIISQSFLFKDIMRKKPLLPSSDYLFCDKAHELEDRLTYSLGWFLSLSQFSDFLFEIEELTKDSKEASAFIDELKKSSDIFWALLGMLIKNYGEGRSGERVRLVFDATTKYLPFYKKFEGALLSFLEKISRLIFILLKSKDQDLERIIFRLKQIKNNLDIICLKPKKGGIYWGEIFGKIPEVSLTGVPLSISKIAPSVFKNKKAVILVSSVLTLKDKFSYFKKRLGLSDFEEFRPTKTEKSISLVVLEDFPKDLDKNYQEILTSTLLKLSLHLAKGLILFNSYTQAREVFERIKDNLQDKVDIFLYLRIGQEKILEDFKNSKRALIFGSKNIFKPTDLKVDYLVFMSLPFEVPFHPISVARGKKLKDSFTEYLLLRAVIKFKEIIENFKKISERKTKLPEKRTVFVLDSRIASKEYGLSFIESLKETDISYRKTEDFLKSNSSSKEF